MSLLAQALAHHQAGRLHDAERLYRAVLDAQPSHAGANHNLGVLEMHSGRMDSALLRFKAALEADPSEMGFWLTYIDALARAGKAGAAQQVLARGRQVGLAGPAVDALAIRVHAAAETAEPYATAVAHHRAGRLADAAAAYRRAIDLRPDHAEAHDGLGVVLRELGRAADAEACHRHALELEPDFAGAHCNLGCAQFEMGRAEEAEACFRRAVALDPDIAVAHNNLGAVLRALGRGGEAIDCYRRASALEPPDAWTQALAALTDPPLLLDR